MIGPDCKFPISALPIGSLIKKFTKYDIKRCHNIFCYLNEYIVFFQRVYILGVSFITTGELVHKITVAICQGELVFKIVTPCLE